MFQNWEKLCDSITLAKEKLERDFNFTEFKDYQFHNLIKAFSEYSYSGKRHISNGLHNEAFVSFMIALELLFGGKEVITKAVCERVSVIISGNSSSQYIKNHSKIKHLYDLRSRLVHDGVKIDPDECYELQSICKKVMDCLLWVQRNDEAIKDDFFKEWLGKIDFFSSALKVKEDIGDNKFLDCGIYPDEGT